MSRYERSGWRDRALANWHWQHRLHCRAAGLGLLMLEYNWADPVAVIEYRHERYGVPETEHPIYQAVSQLVGDLPFFISYYFGTHYGVYLFPINQTARRMLGNKPRLASEAQYVRWLWNIRPGSLRLPPENIVLDTFVPRDAPATPAIVSGLLTFDGTFWVGEEHSRRRREWGPSTPACDLDYMLIDNNTATPIALIEYKHVFRGDLNPNDWSIRAQQRLAHNRLPFYVIRYWQESGVWRFNPVLPAEPVILSESEWLERLHQMRRELPARRLQALGDGA